MTNIHHPSIDIPIHAMNTPISNTHTIRPPIHTVLNTAPQGTRVFKIRVPDTGESTRYLERKIKRLLDAMFTP